MPLPRTWRVHVENMVRLLKCDSIELQSAHSKFFMIVHDSFLRRLTTRMIVHGLCHRIFDYIITRPQPRSLGLSSLPPRERERGVNRRDPGNEVLPAAVREMSPEEAGPDGAAEIGPSSIVVSFFISKLRMSQPLCPSRK